MYFQPHARAFRKFGLGQQKCSGKRSGVSPGSFWALSKLQGDGSGTELLFWMKCGCLGNHHLFGFSLITAQHWCWWCKAETCEFERARPTWQAAPPGQSMQAGDNWAGSGLLRGRRSLTSRDVMLSHPEWAPAAKLQVPQEVTLGYLNAPGWGQCWGWFWLLDCRVSCWGLWSRGLFRV